jgi:transforming growth factor-beta-induced protein
MKNYFKMFTLALLASILLFPSCDDDATVELESIVEIAAGDDQFSILVEALTKADLVTTLSGSGPFTVFAPTNAAFTTLLSDLGATSLDDVDVETLTNILLNHVVSGAVLSTDLTNGYVSTLSPGPGSTTVDLKVDLTSGVLLNNSSSVTTADILASNGVIHIIDEVLLPPSVVDIALQNSSFTSLVAALTAGDNTTDFVSVLSGAGPFTVFAPTDAAFTALLSDLGVATLGEIAVDTRDAVLKYHVVSGANVLAGSLTDGQEVTALGGTFEIDLSTGAQILTTGGQTVNIIVTDVQGTNGVVHVVDAVLLP